MSQKGKSKTSKSDRSRYLDRRRFLAASGAVAGTGVLTGCLGGGEPAENETDGNQTDEDTGGNETDTDDGEPERGTVAYLEQKYPGLEILSPEPENAQAGAREVYDDQFITPREDHFIRNHYYSPDVTAEDWTLTLVMGDEEMEMSMDEIMNDYSTETVTHTMQCSGNGRSYFEPEVAGNQWHYGAVGNAEWTGTPLSDVLEDVGADTGEGMWLRATGGDNPEGEDYFTRSIPMSKVMDDCLLAYEMNGEPMNMEHGFPLRILVPGWYGCNNVKWLDEIEVMDTMVFGPDWEARPEPYTEAGQEYDGTGQRTHTHWQQYSYRIVPEQDERALHNRSIGTFDTRDQMESEEIRNVYMYDQMVKSTIGTPGEDVTVSPDDDGMIEVFGVAWAGDDSVETVEVSPDGGENWQEAELVADDREGPYSWTMFRYMWEAEPGDYTLVSRATDEQGRTQPREIADQDEGLRGIENDLYPWDSGGYGMNAYTPLGVEVTVEEA
ncbi:molybdopterin-dependent oxidoreductase [Haladaptatus sp. F3-133]|uniref:Molybdopterin-dependent oxidoreductase n=1 Tax=Halorutilus salinus TaxID=2487751 RepID=A0A9Q4C5S8_9EURY|nr:molybdopterin-dependent oxidoreductase [Halorutilus salinus]MCX2819464.1 molybdopterin-dependent oxidoreductase [Halorutilus salinus]